MAIAFGEIAPADDDTDISQDLWLLQDRVKILPPPAEPSDANAQEVVFNTFGEEGPIRLLYDISDPDLELRVAADCDSIYAAWGSAKLQEFGRALAARVNVLYGPMNQVRGEQSYEPGNPSPTPKRAALIRAFLRHADQLQVFAEKVNARVELEAQKSAIDRLGRCGLEISLEAQRYLVLTSNTASPSRSSNWADSTLDGPEAANLTDAAAEIGMLVTQERFAETMYRTFMPGVFDPYGDRLQLARLAQFDSTLLKPREQEINDNMRLMNLQPGWEQPKSAESFIKAERQQLKDALDDACSVYPILYRIWDDLGLRRLARLWFQAPANKRFASVVDDDGFRKLLAATCDASIAANIDFSSELTGDPSVVWKYSRPVTAALERLDLPRGSKAWRAAIEKTQSVQSAPSLLSQVTAAAGALDFIVAISGVAPPVAATIALLTTGLFIADFIQKTADELDKDRAYKACLRPSDSLAIEPGSYGGLIVDGLFLLLQLGGVPGSVAKVLPK